MGVLYLFLLSWFRACFLRCTQFVQVFLVCSFLSVRGMASGEGVLEGHFVVSLLVLFVWTQRGFFFGSQWGRIAGMAERGMLFLCYFCAIFCYSGHLDFFLVRLKGGAILCYFLAIFCYFGGRQPHQLQ